MQSRHAFFVPYFKHGAIYFFNNEDGDDMVDPNPRIVDASHPCFKNMTPANTDRNTIESVLPHRKPKTMNQKL